MRGSKLEDRGWRTASDAILYPLSSILAFLFTGCAAPERIPTYPPMPAEQAIGVLGERAHAVNTVSAQGALTLTRPNGDSVRLDAAVVLEPAAGRARVRAWKFGHAVFDLTLIERGVWIEAPRENDRRDEIRAAGGNMGRLTRQWLRLMTGTFDSAKIHVEESGHNLILMQPNEDGTTMACQVDRRTLTPRRYVLKDDRGVERFTLGLGRYAEFGGVVWPRRIEAVSASGKILIELREVEINGEVPPGAFKPPARAEKMEARVEDRGSILAFAGGRR